MRPSLISGTSVSGQQNLKVAQINLYHRQTPTGAITRLIRGESLIQELWLVNRRVAELDNAIGKLIYTACPLARLTRVYLLKLKAK